MLEQIILKNHCSCFADLAFQLVHVFAMTLNHIMVGSTGDWSGPFQILLESQDHVPESIRNFDSDTTFSFQGRS